MQEFFSGKNNKEAGAYSEQKMQTDNFSVSRDEENLMTLSQIPEKVRIDKDSSESIEMFFDEVKKESGDKQLHIIEMAKVIKKNGSNWQDRYFYRITVPKIKTRASMRSARTLGQDHLLEYWSEQMILDKSQHKKMQRAQAEGKEGCENAGRSDEVDAHGERPAGNEEGESGQVSPQMTSRGLSRRGMH